MKKYVDSAGNLYTPLTINDDLDIWDYDGSGNDITYYIMKVHTPYSPSIEQYIIDNIKPDMIYTFTDVDNINVNITIPLIKTGINAATSDTREDSLNVFYQKGSGGNIKALVKGKSGLRNTNFTLELEQSTSGREDYITIGLYRAFIIANNRTCFVNALITAKHRGDETNLSEIQLAGSTGSWYGIEWTIDGIIEEREQDSTSDIEQGGGYGTGSMPTDNIDIPALPVINMADTGATLYSLTPLQIKNFRSWLWTTDWVDNLKKIRTDPMQNIIGISIADVPISAGLNALIYVGNVASTVEANVIYNSFVELDCGEITLDEYYGSFADYEPFIATTLYLPKVGFVQIPADVCVNNTIKVVYHIELSSGEGLCYVQLTSKRDGFSYIWNTYTCHVTSNITLSAQDHSQQLVALGNAIINTGISASNAIVNPASTAQGLTNTLSSCIDVATTKNPTSTKGNVGNMSAVMCYKKPYLLINRTNLTKPSSFQENNGYLINYTAKIGDHTGFLKTKDFHAEFDAPYSHKVELEKLMNEGVFING